MVRMGLPPLAAIQSATVNAADLLGWSDRVGTLEPGKFADLVAVDGDPVADVTHARTRSLRDEGRRGNQESVVAITGTSSARF